MASITDQRSSTRLRYQPGIRKAAAAWVGELLQPELPLTDEQWLLIKDLFASQGSRVRGRPPEDPRKCVEGVLWLLRPGARWRNFPRTFPSPTTCWRRIHQWSANGILQQVNSRLLSASPANADE